MLITLILTNILLKTPSVYHAWMRWSTLWLVANSLLPRLLLWLSPNHSKRRRLDQNLFHHPLWWILLYNYVFRAKNAWATYQRAIEQCLHDEIRDDLIKAYVDDMVMKTRVVDTLIDNLERTFWALN